MNDLILDEQFSGQAPDPRLNWFCEPAHWMMHDGHLSIETDSETDFWQRTHYGFSADNGHFLYANVEGDFTMTTRLLVDYKHQYDQAGLMIRVSDYCWIKSSIEFEPEEENKLGVVVTRHGYSDWSTQNIDKKISQISLRIRRTGSDYVVHYLDASSNRWMQLRMAHLEDQHMVQAGIYACSPKKGGYKANFKYISIERRGNT